MKILGIETSCDETAASVVADGTHVLSNLVASSAHLHARTGGIIPEEAARKQLESILPTIDIALNDAGLGFAEIDAIAVTIGPGLIGSLLVGVETAKTLSMAHSIPIIPVNHLVGHIYANWISSAGPSSGLPEFPALSLVVSGGHTDLVLMVGHGDLKWLGGTRDDAAGEAFDKTARLLGLPYPGGPVLAQKADEYLEENPNGVLDLFPRPMVDDKSYDWSFSGLKTAVSNYFKSGKGQQDAIEAEVQEAIVEVLVKKTMRAVTKIKPKSFILAGGVSANRRLKEKFAETFKVQDTKLYYPEAKYSTDNAACIASAAFYNNKTSPWQDVTANPNLTIVDQI